MDFSVAELTELGALIGKNLREELEKNSIKSNEEDIKKMIGEGVREVLKNYPGHGVAFTPLRDFAPADIVTIQKAIDAPAGSNDVMKQLQDWNDDLYTITSLLKVHPRQLSSYGSYQSKWSQLAKALNTSTAGLGAEWIPTGYSSQMYEAVELEAKVASLFEIIQITSPTYIFPFMNSGLTAYKGGEATTDSPSMYRTSNLSTTDRTFTTVKMVTNVAVTEEMTEDSVVPILPLLRRETAKAIAKGEDNCIINGDTTTAHFDTGYTTNTDDIRRCWKGLRRLCYDANSALGLMNDGSTWSTSAGLALIAALVSEMGVYGVDASKLKLLCNTNVFNKLKSLDQVRTVDKFGLRATVTNGVLSAIDGINIVLSQHVDEQQNNSGIYDGTTVTDTQFLIVYTDAFKRAIRRDIRLDYEMRPTMGINYLVASTRRVWKAMQDTTTQGVIGWMYNITK